MRRIGSAYKYFQHMSLDVVLGALATGYMASSLLTIQLPLAWWIAFPLSVWVFYTSDHLIDAYRLGSKAHTARHQFHVRYFIPLCLLVGISCLLILYATFIAPTPLLSLGLAIGGMGLIHLLLSFLLRNVISRWIQKELGVALVYTCGVWGGPWALSLVPVPPIYMGLSIQFFLLALINLLIFSLQEMETDILDGHTSFVRALGKSSAYRLIAGLLLLSWVIGGYMLWEPISSPTWALAFGISLGISFIFTCIQVYPQWFHTAERYRAWGDGAFVLSIFHPLLSF